MRSQLIVGITSQKRVYVNGGVVIPQVSIRKSVRKTMLYVLIGKLLWMTQPAYVENQNLYTGPILSLCYRLQCSL